MQPDALTKINDYTYYYGTRRGLHTICFVHGLIGHPLKTWGKFPLLLRSDPDLPQVDILMSGYKSRLVWHGVHDLVKLGNHLQSSLDLQIEDSRVVHLVGHSMGGLVILQSLVSEMQGGRAQEHPCRSVAFISLVASPVTGKASLKIVKRTFVLRRLINRHLQALAAGQSTEQLVRQAKTRIYAPAKESSRKRRIPIRMVMATRDGAVDEADRTMIKATFNKLRVSSQDETHGSIKKPVSRNQDRYKAVVNDLKNVLAKPFQAVCKQCLSKNPAVADTGIAEYVRSFDFVVRHYYKSAGGSSDGSNDDYMQFVKAIWRDGAAFGTPVHYAGLRAAKVVAANKALGK